jgi:hypothetical protein
MSDSESGNGPPDLQFDRVVTTSPSATEPSSPATSQPSVACEGCHAPVHTEYYHVNGGIFCGSCRAAIEAAADTPRGLIPFLMAALYGLGAGIAGAAIYYAVIAIANLEIGIVAILIGYMVGYAVRKGARGGGRRFQVLAVVLTYLSVAFAYTPLAIKGAMADGKAGKTASATRDTASEDGRADRGSVPAAPSGGRMLFALAAMFAVIAALPVLVVVGSLPMGLISAFIIFIGMKQAWRMTGTPRLDILGPYRVGADPASLPA